MYVGMEVLISDAHADRRGYTYVVGEKGKVTKLSGSWRTAYRVAIPSPFGREAVWEIDQHDCLPFAPNRNEDALHLLKKQLGGNEHESDI
jgi:hypothetical protein